MTINEINTFLFFQYQISSYASFSMSGYLKKGSRLLLTHRNGMEKVWANKSINQKGLVIIPYFLFGVGVPNPDESGCCPAKDKDCSKAYRDGLAKRLILKKWRPQPDLNPASAGRERLRSYTPKKKTHQ